jgi:hypothetical protein
MSGSCKWRRLAAFDLPFVCPDRVQHPAYGEADPLVAVGVLGPVVPGIPQAVRLLVVDEPGDAAGDIWIAGPESDPGQAVKG